MKKFALFAVLALLTGCDSDRRSAEAAVRAQLIDPDSAKFGEFQIVSSPEEDKACLMVNARNTFGGYTGNQSASLFRKAGESDWIVISTNDYPMARCLEIARIQQSRSRAQ